MAELRVVIADDEPLARRGIHQLLAKHPDCTVIAECRNGKETARALHTLQPDLLFLDIQMPGFNGLQILDAIEPNELPIVVIVTAYDEYAVRAFDTLALDYLLKPVTQERFDRALRRVRERLQQEQTQLSKQLAAFFARTASAAAGTQPIVVPTASGELVLHAAEIDWIEAENYYAAIYTRGKRYLIRESLASLEARLDQGDFVRVHRSAIVRLDAVRELRSDGETLVVLRDGTEIPVSRRRKTQVTERIRSL